MKTPAAPKFELDAVDHRILKRIELDARIVNRDLATAVDLSPSGSLHRVKQLEENGVIRRYIAEINEDAFDGWVMLWGEIALTSAGRNARDVIEARMATAAAVIEARRLVGVSDYLLRVAGREPSVWQGVLQQIDPEGDLIRKAGVQVEGGVAKRFAGLPQIEG